MNDGAGRPRSWTVTRLADVADLQLGKMLDKARTKGTAHQYLRNINVRWDAVDTASLLSMPFEDDERERFNIRDGDLLVCEGGEPGRAAVWKYGPTDLCFQKALHRVRFLGGISPRWAMYQLMLDAATCRLAREFTGSTIAHLPRERLAEYQLRIAPSPEQDRIVDAVDSYLTRLDAASASLKAARTKLKAYRASVLKAAVEGRLVPTEAALARAEKRDFEPADVLLKRILCERRRRWEAAELAKLKAAAKSPRDDKWKSKYEEPPPPAPKDLPALPAGWCWATAQQVASEHTGSICAGPFGTIFKAKDFRPTGIPIIQLRHVKPDRFLSNGMTFMDVDVWAALFRDDYSIFGGELLVTKLGDPPGDCTIYPASAGASMLTPDVMKLRVDEALVHPRYIMHFINSPLARMLTFGNAFGTTRLRLTLQLFRHMPIALPPRQEQERIGEEVDRLLTVADAATSQSQTDGQRIGRLRQAVLKWAFEGKLVDQDNTDEPAKELLERIRVQRINTETAKRTRRARTTE